jgi:phage-related protein
VDIGSTNLQSKTKYYTCLRRNVVEISPKKTGQEIRISDRDGIYRVMYITKIADTVRVLHAFVKKTQRTEQRDIDLAKQRLKEVT